jgi:hypothetical protein
MHEIDPCELRGICIVSVQLGFLGWEVARKYVQVRFWGGGHAEESPKRAHWLVYGSRGGLI